jgi:hypothetical protein
MSARRARPEWRHEDGPGYDLRQYVGGQPTGRVAITAWEDDGTGTREVIEGTQVWLVLERTRLTVIERHERGHGAIRLQIPLRACVEAMLSDGLGLPGSAVIRLTLLARLGSVTITLPLWFDCRDRPALERLVHVITGDQPSASAPPSVTARPLPTLSPLVVDQAPDTDDWIVFRPSPSSEDVVSGRTIAPLNTPEERAL